MYRVVFVLFSFLFGCAQASAPITVATNEESLVVNTDELSTAAAQVALSAIVGAVEDVWGRTPTDVDLAVMRTVKIRLVPAADFTPGLAGYAWRKGTERGIEMPDCYEEDIFLSVLSHELLHHLADIMHLPGENERGDNWDHVSPKTWRCPDSVEARAAADMGVEFWPGYSTDDCR